ncbi:carbohydrate kinase [Actinopolyspora erythraea]|uniref:Carbohydrate kinase n=1 Tax=Actinopolyspora erythraea TaxID=414996 RepID=A0A099DCK5_9ACTN|nr:gluconokinase [Actinopolyspora erythraea]ASU77145.1 carbohydrate kinase [Actinopolyspora erythraea]KGI83160.1 carbohydrate kinase [Actinopolyspora erythraea]
MSAAEKDAVVLGLDLGTTATKVVAADRTGTVLHHTERENPMRTEEPGEAVQDAEAVRDSAVAALAECVGRVREAGHEIRALSFSTAMHTLVGLDSAGEPVTPAFNWADSRCADLADKLREEWATAAQLHRATGTPVHPQSVMVKLAWLTTQRRDLARGAAYWCALKDFVFAAFTGEFVTDQSLASGSGLQDMATLDWHGSALRTAGVEAGRLPRICAPTDTFPLGERIAGAAGLPPGLPVVLGAGDGPLGNLGVGAVDTGVAGLSLGTSGALRVTRDEPGVDERCRTFCYYLADGLWVAGGAVSNGAVVGQWAAESFGVDVASLLDEASEVPPGARGLVALPYLMGERAPWWEPGLTGSLIGLRRVHGRAEITRALVEGVAQQLALVRDAVVDTGARVRAVRATGGGFRSRIWAETIAAALGTELELTEDSGGSAVGAVLLAWRALGELESLDEAADLIRPARTVPPRPEVVGEMRARRPGLERLHRAVADLTPLD